VCLLLQYLVGVFISAVPAIIGTGYIIGKLFVVGGNGRLQSVLDDNSCKRMLGGGARAQGGLQHPPSMWFGSAQGVPHQQQVGPAERLARINSACVQLVEGDVGLGCYATFSSVLSRFCQRAGVAQFEQLGLGPPVAVPCLRYLWDLQVSLPGPAQLLPSPSRYPFPPPPLSSLASRSAHVRASRPSPCKLFAAAV